MACHYLRKLNVKRHGSLMTHLQNQFTLGTDLYPKTLTAAYNLSIKWKSGIEEKQPYQKRFVPLEGVSLATDVNARLYIPQEFWAFLPDREIWSEGSSGGYRNVFAECIGMPSARMHIFFERACPGRLARRPARCIRALLNNKRKNVSSN